MPTVEQEICSALYALYSIECLHWLKPCESAVTRRLRGPWQEHHHTAESYTLLGRMPVMVNPLDLRPSYARVPSGALSPSLRFSVQRLLADSLPRIWLLTGLSIFGAINLLVLLPLFLALDFLPGLLRLWAAWAITIHISLGIEMFLQAKRWRIADKGGFWREYLPMLLNPAAALRCGDILLRATSEIEWLNIRSSNTPKAKR